MDRREFIGSLACAGGLVAFQGCRGFRLGRNGDAPPNYWCTWATQARLVDANAKSGLLNYPGDQGLPGARDNLDENVLFGKDGWANTQYPQVRDDLLLVLDDGWDVPYGCHPARNLEAFSSLELNPLRFPSFKGSPAERLTALNRRAKACGWRGAGLWVACQAFGENAKNRLPDAVLREELKRKLGWCAEAGIAYWKVDWGARCFEIRYRELMSELKAAYAPDLKIEHCWSIGFTLNGVKFGKGVEVTGDGRLVGNAEFEAKFRKPTEAMLACADAFRIYDTITPINNATDLERAVVYGMMAEKVGSGAWINVEDNAMIAACLGHTTGVMRSPLWPEPEVADPVYRRERTEEIVSAVAWQREAPAFTAKSGLRTLVSDRALTDRWTFEPGCTWWRPVFGRTVEQRAPAVVARGLPLPEVRGRAGDVPFVLASRNPSGALAVGALPRLLPGKGLHTPPADVRLDATLEAGRPLGVFGGFASVTVRVDGPVGAVRVRRMSGGPERDIAAACSVEGGWLRIPGEALALGGCDRSIPAVRVEV